MNGKNKIGLENSKGLVRTIESFIEVLTLTVLYYVVWRFCYGEGVFPDYPGNGKYVLMGIYALLSYLLFANTEGFMFGNLRKTDLALSQGIAMLIVNFITYFQLCLIANRLISPLPMLLLLGMDIVLVLLFVFVYVSLYYRLYAPHNMIMIFGTDNAMILKIKMDSRRDKYKVRKLISVDEGYDKIISEIVNYDAVIINDVPTQIRNDILKFCYKHQIRAYVVPKISDLLIRGARDITVFDTPIVMVKGTGLTLGQRFVKRLFDIVLCLIAMTVALPIMLIIAIFIKLEDGGPVLYKQKRATFGGREFDILKFRSMVVDADKRFGVIMASGNDPRVTKVGKIIRRLRIDELPQILNILKGDMSIVGPRPERLEHVKMYQAEVPEFDYRLKVKGGLTGYAQIYGKYNTSPYDKIRLDLMYIENYSLWLDIKLILMTFRIIFNKESTEGADKVLENELLKNDMSKKMKESLGEEDSSVDSGN